MLSGGWTRTTQEEDKCFVIFCTTLQTVSFRCCCWAWGWASVLTSSEERQQRVVTTKRTQVWGGERARSGERGATRAILSPSLVFGRHRKEGAQTFLPPISMVIRTP